MDIFFFNMRIQDTYKHRKSLPSFENWKKQKAQANKRWYDKNKDKIIQKSKEWNKANRDNSSFKQKQNKRFKKWYRKNREKFNKNVLKNYYKDKNKWKIRARTRYHRDLLFDCLGKECSKCGSKTRLEFHHLSYPTLEKGVVGIEKLKKITIVLCKSCHEEIHL